MPDFAVEFASSAAKDLRRLDPPVRQQLLRAMELLRQAPYPSRVAPIAMLQGPSPRQYRLRVGDYRIVYRIGGRRVIVARVAHRRDVYR